MTQNRKMPNRLQQEKSPYLLQHAYNPVDWFPWSDEAFDKAKSEDKPIFLSIGYSTCHWCHVMAHESFEDTEVAKLLNKNYIAIKVDREERPDIDNIYMSVCQALTGSGGWPLTIFMTPDRKPFYAGTYFPKESRMGYTGLMELLEKISVAWNQERKTLIDSSDTIMMHMQGDFEAVHEGDISMEHVHQAFNAYAKSFDQVFGGFGQAPKFPTPHNLSFLLRYWKTTGNNDALKMVEKTLGSMYRGGIYDHIGFGFSRYSTDRKWLVPHFEKMLYDNALIAITCLETYQATGKKTYLGITERIFEYVLRDMISPEGGFYSAEDADSEKEEGKFYIWTQEELVQVLGDADAKTLCAYYDITAQGNFEGKSIPNLIHNQSSFEDLFNSPIEAMRARVYDARQKRIHPYKDDKILTAWNGLMIAALSMGSRIMNNKSYLETAQNAVSFINSNLRRKDGRLLARYRDGEASYPAYLEDYAFLVWGLIELYEASFEAKYLKLALELNDDMIKYFYDEKNSGFFIYGSDSEQLIARPKDVYDGALPSGNSVAAMNLLRLARMTGSSELEDKALRQFEAFGGKVSKYPVGYSHFMMALLFAYSKGTEIVISGAKEDKGTESMFKLINSHFMPYSVWLMNDVGERENGLTELAPFIADQRMTDNKATAYICENFACKAPITDIEQFSQMLYK